MQVILRETVPNLGQSGELVSVREGYGRNYLIPQGLAILATEGNKKQIEYHKKQIALRNAKLREEAQNLVDRLTALSVQVSRQVGIGEKLFGSVTSRDIEQALSKLGLNLDRKRIHLPEPLKTLGEHWVECKLDQDVIGKIKVTEVALSD